jgi:hypothetical protein
LDRISKSLVSVAVVALLLGQPLVALASPSSDQLLARVDSAYVRILQAQHAGGNVTELTGMLNQALVLIKQGEGMEATDQAGAADRYQQASLLIQTVDDLAPQVESAGMAAEQSQLFWLLAFLAALAAVGGLVFAFGGRVFWRVWIRLHRDWLVKKP